MLLRLHRAAMQHVQVAFHANIVNIAFYSQVIYTSVVSAVARRLLDQRNEIQ